MPKRRAPDLARIQSLGTTFISTRLSNTPLGLPDLDEADFSTVMDSIVTVMKAAYLAGYMAGLEQP